MPKGVWMHDWKTPVAKTLVAEELLAGDSRLPSELTSLGGAYVKAQFNLETQRGREAFSDIKFGLVDEYSIGYKVLEDRWETKSGGKAVRHLLKGRWFEWSPVLVGMNDRTATVAVKADGEPEPLKLSDEVISFEDDPPPAEAEHAEKAGDGQIEVGDYVAFDQNGRELRGRVVEVSVQGELEGTSVSGSDEDPALRIQIYVASASNGGWQATNRFIGKLVSEVTRLAVRIPGMTTGDMIPAPAVTQPLAADVEMIASDPMAGQFVREGDSKADDGTDAGAADGDDASVDIEPLSFEQITERVSRSINRSAMSLGGGWVYVVATYPDNVIVRRMDYESDDQRYFRVTYEVSSEGQISLGDVEEVRQTYAPAKSDPETLKLMTKALAEANRTLETINLELKEGRTISAPTYNCLARAHSGIKQADTEIGRLMVSADPKRRTQKKDDPKPADSCDADQGCKGDAARRLRALALEIELAASVGSNDLAVTS